MQCCKLLSGWSVPSPAKGISMMSVCPTNPSEEAPRIPDLVTFSHVASSNTFIASASLVMPYSTAYTTSNPCCSITLVRQGWLVWPSEWCQNCWLSVAPSSDLLFLSGLSLCPAEICKEVRMSFMFWLLKRFKGKFLWYVIMYFTVEFWSSWSYRLMCLKFVRRQNTAQRFLILTHRIYYGKSSLQQLFYLSPPTIAM